MTPVLDASALLAFLHEEPGAETVRAVLGGAVVSAVNWAEVAQKGEQHGAAMSGMRKDFMDIGVVFEPFSSDQAEVAAQLWEPGRPLGLSLADRACLALTLERGGPVLTADKSWKKLDLPIEIRLVR